MKSPSEFWLLGMYELNMRGPFPTAWFRLPADSKEGLVNFLCLGAWPVAQNRLAGAGKREFEVFGGRFPRAFNPIGQNAQSQSVNRTHSVRPGFSIDHNAGKGTDFSNPPPVRFPLDLNLEVIRHLTQSHRESTNSNALPRKIK